MQRKLASIQRVLEIIPIENADAIELVRINGWQCVTKKGEFAVNDLGVYLEIDAIPPDAEPFRFLWQSKADPDAASPTAIVPLARPEKFRIRTMRLRGALSQGLLMPLCEVSPIARFAMEELREGEDVTERFGVEKYEPLSPEGMGERRGRFPIRVPKTEEMRVQSVPAVLEELRGHPYVATLKYDGTSATFAIDPDDGQFHACGRNFSVRDGENLYWRVARKHGLEAILAVHPQMAIQGEIVGPGVQKNPLGLRGLSLFVFDVFDMAAVRHLTHDEASAFLAANGLPAVAVVEEGESFQHTQDSLLRLAEGLYPGTKNEREGIVIRSRRPMNSLALGGRLSFKAISNRHLLKERDA